MAVRISRMFTGLCGGRILQRRVHGHFPLAMKWTTPDPKIHESKPRLPVGLCLGLTLPLTLLPVGLRLLVEVPAHANEGRFAFAWPSFLDGLSHNAYGGLLIAVVAKSCQSSHDLVRVGIYRKVSVLGHVVIENRENFGLIFVVSEGFQFLKSRN